MKPSSLRITSPEKSSAFFTSPYSNSSTPPSRSRTHALSPIPDNSPVVSTSGATSPHSRTDSHTPLLPPSPAMLEKGQGAYPFPSARQGLGTRVRLAVGGKIGRGGIARRVVFITLILVLLLVLGKHATGGHVFSERDYDISQYPLDLSLTADATFPTSTPGRSKFRIPAIPLLPFSNPKPARPSPQTGRREIDISSEPLPVDASLRERLDAWKNAPGGRGEIPGEVEHGGFVQWNLEQCTTIHEQHNTHMIQKSANVWATQNRTTLHMHRMDLINYMEDVLARNLTTDYGEGRGIVMVAGNADTLQRVKWSLQMLRSYDSTLPVQIYHFPSERPDEDDPIREELRGLGAELVEAIGEEKDKDARKSYHLKAIAVVQCPWREVLYLDSDSIPARDPEYMFDAPNYRRLGIWATPDYWKTSANNPIWAIIGVKCRNEWEMETGQMFIDKKLHLDTFFLIKYMLERHEWWFYFSDGDKDIFRWAMLALRKRWAVPGRWVGAAALPSGTASGDFCAHTMLQHDSWGEPLFVHYNLLKQIPSGVGRGFSWGRTKQLPLFNIFPATPAMARLGEPEERPADDERRGLGDVDCDMLADADEYGLARAPAKEMIMRRAARERGVKVKYHGGWISALCIDLDYIDPRPQERKDEDELRKEQVRLVKEQKDQEWDEEKRRLEAEGREVPEKEEWVESPVYPDWGQSPIEIAQWRDDPNLATFEKTIYDLGFKPSGPGF